MPRGLEVHDVALALIKAMRPVVERLRTRDRDLAIQVKKATSAIPSNISEASRRVGRDRLHLFRIAAGSADEVRSHLAVAVAWGDLEGEAIEPALALLDRILAMLWRLTRPIGPSHSD